MSGPRAEGNSIEIYVKPGLNSSEHLRRQTLCASKIATQDTTYRAVQKLEHVMLKQYRPRSE